VRVGQIPEVASSLQASEISEMPDRLAIVFPGQGSQYVGMGLDLYERYPEARALFDEADRVLGLDLSRLSFEGPEQQLNDTINTQAAMLTCSVATLRAMGGMDQLGDVAFVAGHSLGEYTALVGAGAISFIDGLELVRERGRLMKEAGAQRPGGMAAVLGLPADAVAAACAQAAEETGEVIQVANYNLPQQIVISGQREGLKRATELVSEGGARRVVPLAVSIASHSELMEPAARGLAEVLEHLAFQEMHVPVIGNVAGRPLGDSGEIAEELVRQLISPVRWVESVIYMSDGGAKTFVEIGPKDTLSRLIKRIVPEARTISVGDVVGVEAWRRGSGQAPTIEGT
jgi:[acyl-carrier-protein] S-malonyltransferase